MVGAIGSILGEAGVNIAAMQVARREAGGEALMALTVDSSVDAELLSAVAAAIGSAAGQHRRPARRRLSQPARRGESACFDRRRVDRAVLQVEQVQIELPASRSIVSSTASGQFSSSRIWIWSAAACSGALAHGEPVSVARGPRSGYCWSGRRRRRRRGDRRGAAGARHGRTGRWRRARRPACPLLSMAHTTRSKLTGAWCHTVGASGRVVAPTRGGCVLRDISPHR